MKWNVVTYVDGEFCPINVFDDPSFYRSAKQLLKMESPTWLMVSDALMIEAKDLFSYDAPYSIYAQLLANWQRFVDYVWECMHNRVLEML